ncbi:MAG: HAD-IIB family hydrolase [SAR324 cluster bacterium]|nr:HAD-IIB family hydrolase [SAR324 cluster bacterium]
MEKGLYIQLYSVHGLLRGSGLEMGRNADTGGQIKYVVELAKALGEMPQVRKVDLFTRRIRGKAYSNDYNQHMESLSEKVRIIRIQCGGTKYIRKELLWPHLDEFVDKTLKFIKRSGDLPDIVHGHYADAGYVAMEIASFLGVDFIFTGHSLGRPKQERLQNSGLSLSEINRQFRIEHRIDVEEEVIKNAQFIVTSTRQEVEDQYGMYHSGSKESLFSVIPPGIDTVTFYPFYADTPEVLDADKVQQAEFYLQRELKRFLLSPEKPLILGLARPVKRKNITGLITAFGMDKELQAIANLAIFAGIRKDIDQMDDNEREVLTGLLLLMDKYDLYGQLAIPKRADFDYEVPELYRIAARTQGVFVNPAFTEPFGLTLIEAAASGLPIVATDDGGPRDIIQNCQNGVLVDANDPQAISKALKNALVNPEQWREYSQNGITGVKQHYSWQAHCQAYLDQLQERSLTEASHLMANKDIAIGRRFTKLNKLLVTDMGNTLLGDDQALMDLAVVLRKHHDTIGFGVSTGKPLEMVISALEKYKIPHPDVIISSVGTEIYYGEDRRPDSGWASHLSAQWKPAKIKLLMKKLNCVRPQDADAERSFKLSYYLDKKNVEANLQAIHQTLSDNQLSYNLIYSHGKYLDIVPHRASKGKALRYLSYKWNIPLENIVSAGDSDSDEDMLRGNMLAIVVGNHQPEMEKLRGLRKIYFARKHHAAGILEGMKHYKYLDS